MYYDRGPFPFYLIDDISGLGCIVVVLGFVILVAFLAAVARVLTRVAAENRRMEPGQVWLNLIPVFNFIWAAVTVERVGESIRNELVARGRNRKSDGYGKTAGLTSLVLFGTAIVPPVAVVTWPFALIYGVVYWAQLGGYARRLRDEGAAYTPPADEGW